MISAGVVEVVKISLIILYMWGLLFFFLLRVIFSSAFLLNNTRDDFHDFIVIKRI